MIDGQHNCKECNHKIPCLICWLPEKGSKEKVNYWKLFWVDITDCWKAKLILGIILYCIFHYFHLFGF